MSGTVNTVEALKQELTNSLGVSMLITGKKNEAAARLLKVLRADGAMNDVVDKMVNRYGKDVAVVIVGEKALKLDVAPRKYACSSCRLQISKGSVYMRSAGRHFCMLCMALGLIRAMKTVETAVAEIDKEATRASSS